jgi:cyclopropane-fatty-acyl-phospholipid synthase
MSLTSLAARAAERLDLPDSWVRPAIARFVARARESLAQTPPQSEAWFAEAMSERAVAENAEAANAQHYEVPAAFFRAALGPHLKYSSGFYPHPDATLAEAEAAALAATCEHADLKDGQRVLELGCGWGSLSLWMAERYPLSTLTVVSNSHSQRAYIQAQANARGLANLVAITRDMNTFSPPSRYDRIVSVEMFEHMANWRALLTRLLPALEPDGRMFLHVFTHRDRPYRFDASDPDDFIARHFFTGGIMPSHGLIRHFPDLVEVEEEWRWSGEHYRRTAEAWLANFDRESAALAPILRETYGADAAVWRRRWRLFFLAVAGLFGDSGGEVWGVSHYRRRRAGGV